MKIRINESIIFNFWLITEIFLISFHIHYIMQILYNIFSLLLLYVITKREHSSCYCFTSLLIYSVPISSVSISGTVVSNNPFSLFFILGLVIMIISICKGRISINQENNQKFIIILFFICYLCLLFIRNINGIAMNEFINFVYILIFILIFFNNSFQLNSVDEYKQLKNYYINVCVISCIFIIIQSSIQTMFHLNFFDIRTLGGAQESVIIGGGRIISSFLFLDISTATIGLVTGIYILLFDEKKYKNKFIKIIIIMMGSVLSSARTGFISLIIILLINLILTNRKKFIKIVKLSIYCIPLIIIAYVFLLYVRGDSVQLLQDNGRFDGYTIYLNYMKENLLLGYTLGSSNLEIISGIAMPHFTLLNLFVQTGFIGVVFIFIIGMEFYISLKKYRCSLEMNILLLSLIGSCFIPELYSSKFFLVIVVMSILSYSIKEEKCIYEN